MFVWRFGGLEVWKFRGLEVWRFGSLEIVNTIQIKGTDMTKKIAFWATISAVFVAVGAITETTTDMTALGDWFGG